MQTLNAVDLSVSAGCGLDQSPPRCIPNVTSHPSTASVPTSYHSMWHYNCTLALPYRPTLKELYVTTVWNYYKNITLVKEAGPRLNGVVTRDVVNTTDDDCRQHLIRRSHSVYNSWQYLRSCLVDNSCGLYAKSYRRSYRPYVNMFLCFGQTWV